MDCHHELDTTLQKQEHAITGGHAQLQQQLRQRIGAALQVGITDALIAADDSRLVRELGATAQEALLQQLGISRHAMPLGRLRGR